MKLYRFLLLLFILGLLSACGQSGALYLPDENRQPAKSFIFPPSTTPSR
jgi:predicted small lipoprotein YifL